jgi:hypothetical protein
MFAQTVQSRIGRVQVFSGALALYTKVTRVGVAVYFGQKIGVRQVVGVKNRDVLVGPLEMFDGIQDAFGF